MVIKINLITYNNSYGLTKDVQQLQNSLTQIFHDVDCQFVNFYDYKCRYADINIFLEIISNLLLKYAKYNILIPNQEWFYKTWKNYINLFDLILVKTKYAESIFLDLKEDREVKYLGWKSLDRKLDKKISKEKKFIHVCGKSIYKQTQTIIDNWNEHFSHLTIIFNPKDVKLKIRDLDNITYITNKLSEIELNELMNKSCFHLCCSETEGYGHYINEAKSCGSLVVSTDAPPMNELINSNTGILIKVSKKNKLKHTLGSSFYIDIDDFKKNIQNLNLLSDKSLKIYGKEARKSFEEMNENYIFNLKNIFGEIFNKISKIELPKELSLNKDLLPKVSIITLVYNRKRFFKLSLLNYFSINYPRDKLEWIIIDDSKKDERVEDMVPSRPDIHYYLFEEHLKIGNKRNIGIEKANYEYISFMDDDDYYPPDSVKIRIQEMIANNKACSTCTSIACFQINKYISMVNVPPHQLPFEERISEASLSFSKKFWEKQKFSDQSSGGEAREFLKNRELECIEISWEGVIVSLLHSCNTSTRVTMTNEPNGCHFGFSDKLFTLITSLDNSNDLVSESEVAISSST